MKGFNLDSIEFDLTEAIEDLILYIKTLKTDIDSIKKHLNFPEEIRLPIHTNNPRKFL